MTEAIYPDRAWFEANFQQWSGLLNMKFVVRAAELLVNRESVTERVNLTDAVSRMISTTVAELEAEHVPADIIASFKDEYGAIRRDDVLNAVCAYAVMMAPAFQPKKQRNARKRPSSDMPSPTT